MGHEKLVSVSLGTSESQTAKEINFKSNIIRTSALTNMNIESMKLTQAAYATLHEFIVIFHCIWVKKNLLDKGNGRLQVSCDLMLTSNV